MQLMKGCPSPTTPQSRGNAHCLPILQLLGRFSLMTAEGSRYCFEPASRALQHCEKNHVVLPVLSAPSPMPVDFLRLRTGVMSLQLRAASFSEGRSAYRIV